MGRMRLGCLTVLAGFVVASCGTPQSSSLAGGDMLFISARGGGLAVMEPDASEPTFKGRNSVPSADWSTIVKSSYRGNTTKLVALDPAKDIRRWETVVSGMSRVKIVSGDGFSAALGPWNERSYLSGRARTKLTIVGSKMPEPRMYELDGNFEPEAFSTDGQSVFVVSYLPPTQPKNYQVRRLDLQTGEVTGVYTPDGHLQQSMGGTARIQAASPDGTRLYTLYTLEGNKDSESRAFVHVLALDELWAHCIELQKGFESSDQSTGAVTVSMDGKRVYLADSNSERLVEIDAERLQVSRQGSVDLDIADGTYLTESPDGTLYAASGVDVVSVDLETFEQNNAWQMFSSIAGLQVGDDPKELYVGVDDRVIILDVTTGLRLGSIDPVGVRKIGGFGAIPPSILSEEEYFTCAC